MKSPISLVQGQETANLTSPTNSRRRHFFRRQQVCLRDASRLAAVSANESHGPGATFIAPDGFRLTTFAATDQSPELIIANGTILVLGDQTGSSLKP